MAVFGFVKFQVCFKEWISVLNLNLKTPDLKPLKNWMFLSNCVFYYLVLYKPQQRNLEFWTYFSVISFLCSAAKEGFQTQLFKTRVLTQPDFENSKKIHFKPEKGHFWFTLKGPMISCTAIKIEITNQLLQL